MSEIMEYTYPICKNVLLAFFRLHGCFTNFRQTILLLKKYLRPKLSPYLELR